MFIYLNKKIAIPNQVKLRCAQWNTEHVRAARLRAREGEGERGRERERGRGGERLSYVSPACTSARARACLPNPGASALPGEQRARSAPFLCLGGADKAPVW